MIGVRRGYEKACGDGLDNDADGFIDYPADLDCASYTDDEELNDSAIIEPLAVDLVPPAAPSTATDTAVNTDPVPVEDPAPVTDPLPVDPGSLEQ